MSEKKILCMEMESPCVKCGSTGKLCSICATIKRYKSWPTSEQAIEKMANALQSVAVDRGGVDLDDDSTLDPRMLAEAALDALLEGNNGN